MHVCFWQQILDIDKNMLLAATHFCLSQNRAAPFVFRFGRLVVNDDHPWRRLPMRLFAHLLA